MLAEGIGSTDDRHRSVVEASSAPDGFRKADEAHEVPGSDSTYMHFSLNAHEKREATEEVYRASSSDSGWLA